MKILTKNMKVLLPILALVFTVQEASAQTYKKVTRLGGTQAVCRGGLETAEQLQSYFAANPDTARGILADAGISHVADDLLAAIASGDFTENAYPVGTRLAWMGARQSRGSSTMTTLPYREWAGAKSMDSFQVNVSSNCQVYHIAIPKACCNISLVSSSPDNSVACNPPAAVAPAPAPEPVAVAPAPKALALIPFLGVFAGTESRPRYEALWDMDVMDSATIKGLRGGLIKELSEKTSMFGQVSYYDRSGVNSLNTYSDDNFAIDIGLDRKLSEKTFIGGGLGAWNVDDSDYRDASLFGHVGGDIGASAFQWLLEARVFDSDSDTHDSISDNKMFSAGVRYLFNK